MHLGHEERWIATKMMGHCLQEMEVQIDGRLVKVEARGTRVVRQAREGKGGVRMMMDGRGKGRAHRSTRFAHWSSLCAIIQSNSGIRPCKIHQQGCPGLAWIAFERAEKLPLGPAIFINNFRAPSKIDFHESLFSHASVSSPIRK